MASDPLLILRDVFGYPAFRGHQRAIIDRTIAGLDSVVLMPTGAGKSLCYQVPAIVRPGVGIVISPLIALMQDQVDALRLLGVRAAFWNSTLDAGATRAVRTRLSTGELDLLYVAPERLLMPDFLRVLDAVHAGPGIALFAIDEAHCVSAWGHDFRPEYLQLAVIHERFPAVPRLALTATADRQTREEIQTRLALAAAEEFVSSFDRPNISYTVVDKQDLRQQLLSFTSKYRGEAGIVYCQSRRKSEQAVEWLRADGFDAEAYHAGLPDEERRRVLRRFSREDGVIVAATIAFGMGIDKPDVRFVAHTDLPKSLEGYYQETGRAGRDGEPAQAWMAYGLADLAQHARFRDESDADERHKRMEGIRLDAMLGYAEASGCRRVILLNYFGEQAQPCGNCDNCQDPPALWDGTEAAQKALSAVLRTGERFGAAHLIDVLMGKATARVANFGHDQLKTFGCGMEFDADQWRNIYRQLVAHGMLRSDPTSMGALKLTARARSILFEGEHIELRVPQKRHRGRVAAGAPASTARASTTPEAAMSDSDETLFQELRAQRRVIADAEQVPAFIVLHDKTLRELATTRPTTLEQLPRIPGMGATKIAKYGQAFLDVIRAFGNPA